MAATVSVEHLKGRLENARHAVADNILEQEQQVEQLRTQIKDLKQRLNVSADAAATQQLRRKVLELEERCALQNSQLMRSVNASVNNFSQHTLAYENSRRGNLRLCSVAAVWRLRLLRCFCSTPVC
ncbi:hypothetical protein ERJ75_000234000 [Trypanosoma vivax]|nr:hypothetical protein ERJ75_000234000 [Trypanosoma vivax]